MKKVILFALSALALVSCKKSANDGPFSSQAAAQNYAALTINAPGQVVKMSVTSNVLNMIYNEDVTLVLDSSALAHKYAVHLVEGFAGTQLAAYDYHSLTISGVNATNWVDDNLNNVVIQSSKDTLINNKLFVKKRITRSFLYQKAYNTSADANKVLEQLLKQNDIITFTSFYAPNEPEVAPTVNTAKLTYVRM